MTDTPRPAPGALTDAVKAGKRDLVKMLLAQGADANERTSNEMTPLIFAVVRSFELVEALVNAGADVNARNGDGHTALKSCILAMKLPSFEKICMKILRFLIDEGVALDAADAQGMDALQWARSIGNETAEKIIQNALRNGKRRAKASRIKEFHNTAHRSQVILKTRSRKSTIVKNTP